MLRLRCWKRVCDQAGPIYNIIKCVKASGLDLTPSPRNAQKEACLFYHITGPWNARCRNAGDHHLYPSRGERALMEWNRKSIPDRRGEGSGGKGRLRSVQDLGIAGHGNGR